MSKRFWMFLAIASTMVAVGVTYAQQYPMLDMVAQKVVQKYQSASCEQLWQERAQGQGKPKPEMEQRLIGMAEAGCADASGVLQQGLCAHRQQDVRMRDDSVSVRS